MLLIGKSKKAMPDNQSMVSIPLSRKSSFSSNASALAFSSPSPNHMSKINESNSKLGESGFMITEPQNHIIVDDYENSQAQKSMLLTPKNNISNSLAERGQGGKQHDSPASIKSISLQANESAIGVDYDNTQIQNVELDQSKSITSKVALTIFVIYNLKN